MSGSPERPAPGRRHGGRATARPARPGTGDPQRAGPAAALDLRLVVPALSAWAVAWAALALPRLPAVALAAGAGLVCIAALVRGRWRLAACAVVGLSAALSAVGQQWALESSPLAQAGRERAVVEVVARVRSDPRSFEARGGLPRSTVVPVSVQLVDTRGTTSRLSVPAELVASGDSSEALSGLRVGQRISALGKASAPADRADGLAARIRLSTEPRQLGAPGPVDSALNRVRDALSASMAAATPEQAGLVPSLVVGDTSGLDAGLTADFKTSGLTHLTAVSGTNLTLMLVFVLTCARAVGVRGWSLRAMAFPVVIGFVLLCRSEPSVVRAAAMGLVALAATGRRGVGPAGLRQLSVAVWLLVLTDPWLARSWGFALSAAATGGILWWAGRWQRRMRRWAPAWLAESVCVPLAAQLATQPLVTTLSGAVSMVGIVANAVVAPFVGPVTVLGMAAGALGVLCPPLGVALGWLAGWCVQPVILVAHATADLPAATLNWPAHPLAVAVLTASCAGIAWLIGRVAHRPLVCVLLCTGMFCACLWRPPPPGWPGDWAVVSCDVGQGDATLVRTGRGSAILIDAGPEPDAIASCLRDAGIARIALLVLSHFHADHVGGLPGVYRAATVQAALLNPLDSPAREAAAVRRMLAAQGTPTRTAAPGDQLVVGEASWQTLQAAPFGTASASVGRGEGESAAENDSSVLARVSRPELSILVTGDMGADAQRTAQRAGVDLRADVLKVPHHGSADQDEAFLAATGARIALVSVGADNGYGHPTRRTLGTLSRHSMTVARTDERGDIALVRRPGAHLRLVSRR